MISFGQVIFCSELLVFSIVLLCLGNTSQHNLVTIPDFKRYRPEERSCTEKAVHQLEPPVNVGI
jgi:hypothetical protein